MAVYTVTGPSTSTEGQNITLTVSRQGDLSQAAYLRASTVAWGDYSPAMQMVSAGDQEQVNGRLIYFAPGEARQSISYSTYSDNQAENWEYSFVRFDAIDYYGADRFTYRTQDGVFANMNSNIWGTKVYDPGLEPSSTITPQPTVTQTTPLATQTVLAPVVPAPVVPAVVPSVVNNVYTNVDNSVTNTYTDNSTTNNYVNSFNTDASTNITGSYNTDNSVNNYTLTQVVNANDYSFAKTISGSGSLQGTSANDLITGGKTSDYLTGANGNDKLIGGAGKDSLFGGLGSNVYNAGTSKSRRDADRLYIQREANAVTADIIESIGKSDRIYIQGSTGDLSVRGIDGGLGIFDNDVLQAIYTGNNFNASNLNNQLVAA